MLSLCLAVDDDVVTPIFDTADPLLCLAYCILEHLRCRRYSKVQAVVSPQTLVCGEGHDVSAGRVEL